MSNQPVAEATTYTTQNKHNKQTLLPSAGFQPLIPATKQLHTYTLKLHAHWEWQVAY